MQREQSPVDSVDNVHTPWAGQTATFPLPQTPRWNENNERISRNLIQVMSSAQPRDMNRRQAHYGRHINRKGDTNAPHTPANGGHTRQVLSRPLK
ncbi:hypothetical protein ABIB17_002085 [Arthrobacter sp. UYEF6]